MPDHSGPKHPFRSPHRKRLERVLRCTFVPDHEERNVTRGRPATSGYVQNAMSSITPRQYEAFMGGNTRALAAEAVAEAVQNAYRAGPDSGRRVVRALGDECLQAHGIDPDGYVRSRRTAASAREYELFQKILEWFAEAGLNELGSLNSNVLSLLWPRIYRDNPSPDTARAWARLLGMEAEFRFWRGDWKLALKARRRQYLVTRFLARECDTAILVALIRCSVVRALQTGDEKAARKSLRWCDYAEARCRTEAKRTGAASDTGRYWRALGRVWSMRSSMEAWLGRYGSALDLLLQAWQLPTGDDRLEYERELLYHLAVVYSVAGRHELVLDCFDRLVSADWAIYGVPGVPRNGMQALQSLMRNAFSALHAGKVDVTRERLRQAHEGARHEGLVWCSEHLERMREAAAVEPDLLWLHIIGKTPKEPPPPRLRHPLLDGLPDWACERPA